jgi:hypothetical protein
VKSCAGYYLRLSLSLFDNLLRSRRLQPSYEKLPFQRCNDITIVRLLLLERESLLKGRAYSVSPFYPILAVAWLASLVLTVPSVVF